MMAASGLGEDGVGIDVATTSERVSAGIAEQVAPAGCLAQFSMEFLVQSAVGWSVAVGECRDQLLAGGRVGGVRDLGLAGGEELLFLELDSFPGRVADDAGEAACPAGGRVDAAGAVADAEDVRELDVPVEEAVLAGETLRPVPRRRPGPSVPASSANCSRTAWVIAVERVSSVLGWTKAAHQASASSFWVRQFGGGGEFLRLALLVDVQVFEAVGHFAGDLGRLAWRGPRW